MSEFLRLDLQFHPFVGSDYGVLEILEEMQKKGLDGLVCLEYPWQKGVSLEVITRRDERVAERYSLEEQTDVLYVFREKGSQQFLFLILGQEVALPNQEHHFLSIGALGIKPRKTSQELIDNIFCKGGLLVFDHPFASPRKLFSDVSSREEETVRALCQENREKMALEWNGYSLSWLRRVMPFYGNINQKVEKLGKQLNMPVVPTTDVHAVNKKALKAMGTCYIEVPSCAVNRGNIPSSLAENILSFNFKEKRGYVPLGHLLGAFIGPYLGSKLAAVG